MRSSCGRPPRTRLRRRLPLLLAVAALTLTVFAVVRSPFVPAVGALTGVLLVLTALRTRRRAHRPGGRPPGGDTAGVREPRRPRPTPPAGVRAMPIPSEADEAAWA